MADYIHYAPMADVEGQEQLLFCYTDSLTLEDAMRSFEVWETEYQFHLTKCWVDVYRNGDKIHTINLKRTWVPDTVEVQGETLPYKPFVGLTLREIVAQKLPKAIDPRNPEGVVGCPSDYSFLNSSYDLHLNNSGNCCSVANCTECWNQIFKE